MDFRETVRTAITAILGRKLRSALTMLGILIGIAAVMLTVGLGQGAQAEITGRINALGSNLLIVSPGSTTSSSGIRGGVGSATTLTLNDAAMLADRTVAPDVEAVAPVLQSSASVVSADSNWTTMVVGSTPDWTTVRARTITQGRFFTAAENAAQAPVAVIGTTTASNLFGNRSPVGQTIQVKGVTLTVIGELNSAGSSITGDQDDTVVVPIATFTQRISGGSGLSVASIYLSATSQDTLSAAYQESSAALNTAHGTTSDTQDFTVNSQQTLVNTIATTTQTLTALLGSVAAISLLVGGIGVMNIMLVSVTERTREIGLRKALGATPVAIRQQFLTEASMLGLIGGLLGVGLGLLGSVVLTKLLSFQVQPSWPATLVALVVSLLIGVVAGVYPASRAAKLAPIDALRTE
ncbi:putative ABC transport system permease protein [Raineyella antarctica]|uniref:Putative ABC transport system permease protein n=1 Tax=Raineyella antarctica TaxID=1577474 RepID=A0A1G6GLA7_9ACTN|nr:ABC transporter permease [Raineyella antarctica]SDB82802.1 putative ABC transport system permease protein [Raineyella antarctica]